VHLANTSAVGFYMKACDFQKSSETEGCLTLEKKCTTPEELLELEAAERSPDDPLDKVMEEEEEEQTMNETPTVRSNEKVGDARTALKVWLASITFWNTISQKINGADGDYDKSKLEEYATKGQAAGKVWALAIQKHTDGRCNWQYVHDTFAHFYEDVMVHGHPETYDDSILEAGNRATKNNKRILFWGGTDEDGATYEQERATGKRDKDGNPLMKKVVKRANVSPQVALLENAHLAQHFALQRGSREPSDKEILTKEVKSEQFDNMCKANAASLQKMSDKMDADEALSPDPTPPDPMEAEAPPPVPTLSEAEVKAMMVGDLRAALKARGLPTDGLKAVLLSRLLSVVAAEE